MSGKNKPVEYISCRKFAKSLGVTHQAVMKAMDDGRISDKGIYIHPGNGHRKIIEAVARVDWEKNYNPDYDPMRAGKAKVEGKRDGASKDKETLLSVRIAKGKIDVQKAMIELKKQRGELVNIDDVYKTLFEFGKQLRDSLVVIPDRITDKVKASKNRNEIHTIIKDAIEDSLRGWAEVDNLDFTQKK